MVNVTINGQVTSQKTAQASFKARIVKNGNALAINIPKEVLKRAQAQAGVEVIAKIKFLQKKKETQSLMEITSDLEKLREIVPGLKDKATISDLWSLFLIRDKCDKNRWPVSAYFEAVLKEAKGKNREDIKKLEEINNLITKDGKNMGDWLGKTYKANLKVKGD